MSKKSKSFFSILKNKDILPSIILLILVGFLFYKKLFVFSILLFLATSLEMLSYKFVPRFNFGHVFFLSLLLTRHLELLLGIIFLVIGEFMPRISTRDIDMKSIVILPVEIGLLIISRQLLNTNFVYMGIVLATINYAILFFIARFSRESIPEIATEVGLAFFMNIIYFISLSGPLTLALGYVIAG